MRMRLHPRLRSASVLTLVTLAGLGATQVASAGSPFDHLSDPVGNPGVPECLADAPNTSGARICKVRPFARPDWQAETGEWIIVRTAWAVADQAACPSLEAIVPTYTLDGEVLAIHTTSCQFSPTLDAWQVDFRALSPPLPPGDHSISTTYYFPMDVLGGPAGTTRTFDTTVSVSRGLVTVGLGAHNLGETSELPFRPPREPACFPREVDGYVESS